jgi:hypothetical protein
MHKKHAAQGLAVVSVSLDDLSDGTARETVLAFLKEQRANFTNVILDEKEEVWQAKLKILGPPCFYVFNREGKHRKFDPSEIDDDLAGIEKQVIDWLKPK